MAPLVTIVLCLLGAVAGRVIGQRVKRSQDACDRRVRGRGDHPDGTHR